jgi:putative DNA primase/helicase
MESKPNSFDAANPDTAPYFVPKSRIELLGEVAPYYDSIAGDLVYIGTKIDKDSGGKQHAPPLRLCKDLEVIGQGIDDYGDHYRLLSWCDALTKQDQTLALPAAAIGEREGWGLLNSKGLAVASGRMAREKLADYLQSEGDKTRYVIANQSGWKHGAFVLPTGEVIGTPESKIFYPASATHRPAFAQRGTSQDWRNNVGVLAKSNPLPMTAVACSLAGAVLELIGARDGIGLHLHTETSGGKSTCADIAASIWGNPSKIMQSWDGTSIGLTNSAEFANSMMLYLDEIGAGDARKMGSIIYTMLNGVSRTQGRKEGGNRAKRTWLMTLISTGEIPMGQFLNEGGQAVRGGQEIRMLDIPADGGKYRAFDCIHQYKDGGAFSIAVTDAARSHYGSVGRDFVAWLIANKGSVGGHVKACQDRMLAELPDHAAAPVKRATRKWGILAAALVMAGEAELTGWEAEESYQAVRIIWQRWLADFGLSSRDDERLIEQVENFLEANQFGRFALLPLSGNDPIIHNLAGYRRIMPDGTTEFYLNSAGFKEATQGYEIKKAREVLHMAGILHRPDGRNQWTKNVGNGLGVAYTMTLRASKGM